MNTKSSILTLIVVAIIAIGSSILFKPSINVGVSPTPVTVNVPEQKTPIVNVNPQVRSPDVKVNVPESSRVFGAVSGPDVNFHMFLNEGVTTGGRVATTSTATTYTLVARDFTGTPSYLDWTPNLNTTLSLTSTSTFGYVPNIGDVARVMVRNASSTAASSITFAAANANVDLQFSEATGGDLVLNGLDFAELIIIREDTYRTTVIFNEFTEAD